MTNEINNFYISEEETQGKWPKLKYWFWALVVVGVLILISSIENLI
jgi:uncharacterized membrane protein YhaH (DUF805 family)